ncbi:unnamed protein product [Diabrotica balteata]|uniref:Uncharacterized protein n=1 Tax=Diabrotica balteata TaxID=107213 RepID=A0A9N9SRE8_DIABA|nr:unnamed protein product [Diabrotica balteata]
MSWIPPIKHGFLIVALLQCESQTFLCTLLYGYDFIFMLTAIELTMQFKILNQAFRNMKTKHDMLECVNYHRLLLGKADASLKIKGCTYATILLSQLAIFCFPSAMLQDEVCLLINNF